VSAIGLYCYNKVRDKMKRRLVLAIVSTILEEVAIAVIVLWALPKADIDFPLWGLIIIMVAWAAYAIFTFRLGTLALKREQLVGLPNMIGTRGDVVSPLTPEGLVRIRGELWVAKAEKGEMKPGNEVTVVGQNRLKLVVRDSSNMDDIEVAH
jgi:membrane-bound ClpP family serine protease